MEKSAIQSTNQTTIIGVLTEDFTLSHEVFGEKFYRSTLSVDRLSDAVDIIPILVSERLIDVSIISAGNILEVSGQYRSFNHHLNNGMNKLELNIFAREIEILPEIPCGINTNTIHLEGYLCHSPKYRSTPTGRQISDIMVAVNRNYGKSDYIPCICWGRNAKFAKSFKIGDHIILDGRIQSREYQKNISKTEFETRTAYEVSVSQIEKAENDHEEDS